MKIEVKTYEESRLEFFKDLARKAEKKLDKCIRAMKQSDYDNPLSENHIALDDALEKKSFYADIVCMLFSENHTKWISVKERLPEDNQEVITYSSSGEIEVLKYDNHDIKDTFVKYGALVRVFNVTHWMPLPEVPKERAEE